MCETKNQCRSSTSASEGEGISTDRRNTPTVHLCLLFSSSVHGWMTVGCLPTPYIVGTLCFFFRHIPYGYWMSVIARWLYTLISLPHQHSCGPESLLFCLTGCPHTVSSVQFESCPSQLLAPQSPAPQGIPWSRNSYLPLPESFVASWC